MKKIFLILILSLFICGCAPTYIYVRDEKPIIPLPDRPKIAKIAESDIQCLMPEVKKDVIDTVNSLKIYSLQLENSILTYNEWAKERNQSNDVGLNLNQPVINK